MFINELPEECLLIIFGLINELDDLLNCYKVCSKWSHLIAERTRTVKYLIGHRMNLRKPVKFPSSTFGFVYYQTEASIDGTCLSTLFPNLIIADFSGFRKKVKQEDIVTLVQTIKSLKGLIHPIFREEESIFQYCDELELVSTNYIAPCMEKNGVNIKQLHLWNITLDLFKEDAHYFPNLERLFICNEDTPDGYYDGPIFSRLKILELSFFSFDTHDTYYGFQFMDSCPNLQSAHIFLTSKYIFVDESFKHKSLQDLVIEFFDFDCADSADCHELKRLLLKYPNLKHLALRTYKRLENEHVEQLVRSLPHLVLFAVRGCPRVTQKAADYVQDYCKLHGRSIKFYFDDNFTEIQSDWHRLSTKCEKISLGFDFMKNCFLKDFHSLSNFLISDED